MENELNFFANELVNFFPDRIKFPSKTELYDFFCEIGIISKSNYLDFDDFISYQNAKDIINNINSKDEKIKFYSIYACSFFINLKCSTDLIELLNDEDIAIKTVVIYTLGELKVKEASTILLEQIDNFPPALVNETIMALGKIKNHIAIEKIEELIKKDEYNLQSIIATGRLGHENGIKTVVKYIKAGSDEQKCVAIYASLNYKSTKLNQILINELRKSHGFIADIIVYVLGEKKIESAINDIIENYVNGNISNDTAFGAVYKISKTNNDIATALLKGNNPPARILGAKVLAEIGNQTAVADIIEAYEDEYIFTLGNVIMDSEELGSGILAFDDVFVIEEYIKALGKLGGYAALIEIDKACVNEYPSIAEISKITLDKMIIKESVRTLMKTLEHLRDETKVIVLKKLLKSNATGYKEIITYYINDKNDEISYLCALYLGKEKDTKAIGKLSEIASLNNEYSAEAQKLLKNMGF